DDGDGRANLSDAAVIPVALNSEGIGRAGLPVRAESKVAHVPVVLAHRARKLAGIAVEVLAEHAVVAVLAQLPALPQRQRGAFLAAAAGLRVETLLLARTLGG